MFLREAMRLAAAGIGAGVLAALGFTRFLQGLLYGIRASDPLILASVIGCLTLVALGDMPRAALRATRVDPVTAWR